MEQEVSYLAIFISWLPLIVLMSPIFWFCVSIKRYTRRQEEATRELVDATKALVSSNQQLIQSLHKPAEDNELGTS
ncbi:hypothetical protein IWQ49_002033 [Labrenzia sp. EL_126]|nr:hypothetical protein [Labrenzia sp. EL_126]